MTVVVALLAVTALWISGVSHWVHAALLALTAAITGRALANLLLPRVKSILWRSDGGVEIRLRDRALEEGREVQGTVQGARVLGPLIVLTLRWPARARATIWLLPDNLDGDTRRRLRMRLAAATGSLASGNADSG